MARKVGIYTRISRDDEGEALGVARQRTDCERLIEIFDERPKLEFATVTNDVNLGSADGRTIARVMVAFADKSSHDTSRRIKRKHLELAQQGKSNGGPAPYGWCKDDRNKVDPDAAGVIRAAQKDVLAGVRIGTIRTKWQEEGHGNPREGTKRMAHHRVEHILTNPRLVGYRTYHGVVLYGANGEPVMGEWEVINTVEEWEAVCAAIAERGQEASPPELPGSVRPPEHARPQPEQDTDQSHSGRPCGQGAEHGEAARAGEVRAAGGGSWDQASVRVATMLSGWSSQTRFALAVAIRP
ncbi:recombinase family protein [Streptomyces sp. SCSIO 30461]|uniref:recombinase family protein n=1 Tax=Streptomyces sp. SCSIO 30461 TaxID=3118085 RepID=UPI0030CFFCF6